jgi:hypothetical protein
MIFMVSLLGLPAPGAEHFAVCHPTATGAGDAGYVGFLAARDNSLFPYMIYAETGQKLRPGS